jgi:hypothetical protein
MLDHQKTSPYSEGRLEDLDVKSLKQIQEKIKKELYRRGIEQIRLLEEEANEVREAIGLKRRLPLKVERPLKGA